MILKIKKNWFIDVTFENLIIQFREKMTDQLIED